MTIAGDLSCLRLHAKCSLYQWRSGTYEPYKILPVVSSDIDILVICGDEGSYEEAPERISAVPGGDRAGSLQETIADPPKCDYDGLEESW